MVNKTEILRFLEESDSALDWFEKHIKELKIKYNQEFVAADKNGLVANNKSLEGLLNNLKELGKTTSEIVIQFISKKKCILMKPKMPLDDIMKITINKELLIEGCKAMAEENLKITKEFEAIEDLSEWEW